MSKEVTQLYKQTEEIRKAARTQDDMQEVISVYQRLAEQGHARSAFRLGNIYFRGTLVDREPELGLQYYESAATMGFDPAWRYLGVALLSEERGEEAFEALDKASEAGITGFELIFAKSHLRRKFGRYSDPEEGLTLLKAIAKGGDVKPKIELAKVYSDPRTGFANYESAFDVLKPLADSGEPAALQRVAKLYQSGLGVRRSYPKASDYYFQAAEAGQSDALLGAAEMEVRRGKPSNGRTTLERAIETGVEGADLQLANGHIRGMLGSKSDRSLGVSMIKEGVEKGDPRYIALALNLRADNFKLGFDSKALLEKLEPFANSGNASAAASFLRFVRQKPRLSGNYASQREALINRYADTLSEATLAEEKARFIIDTQSTRAARAALSKMLSEASADEYYDLMVGVSRADKNVYTYLIQSELAQLGAYSGKKNGRLTKKTLNSVVRFCRDSGFRDECQHGPLRGSAVRMVSAALATRQ